MKSIIVILSILILSGCFNNKPSPIIDNWWNIDYAKQSCNHPLLLAGESKESCEERVVSEVNLYVLSLTTQLSQEAECNGINILNFTGPNSTSIEKINEARKIEHFELSIDFVSDSPTQEWKMSDKNLAVTQGGGSLSEIAKNVCKVINGNGGRIL